jgi:hypothetical protein
MPAYAEGEVASDDVKRYWAKVYVVDYMICQNCHAARSLCSLHAIGGYDLGRCGENNEKRDIFYHDSANTIPLLARLIGQWSSAFRRRRRSKGRLKPELQRDVTATVPLAKVGL